MNAPLKPALSRPPTWGVPPLEPGDLLTRDEFERRYAAMPEGSKAELIEGVVYMPAAVRLGHHASPHARLIYWLCLYQEHTQGILVGDNASVRLDLDNEPQPDAVMLVDPNHGGSARVNDDDYVEGSPEFVAEVASSSASIDSNAKVRVYRRAEIPEYLLWRVADRQIDWLSLHEGDYRPLAADEDGILRSRQFPGLWLDREALFTGDLKRLRRTIELGVASPEHAAFAADLAKRRTSD